MPTVGDALTGGYRPWSAVHPAPVPQVLTPADLASYNSALGQRNQAFDAWIGQISQRLTQQGHRVELGGSDQPGSVTLMVDGRPQFLSLMHYDRAQGQMPPAQWLGLGGGQPPSTGQVQSPIGLPPLPPTGQRTGGMAPQGAMGFAPPEEVVKPPDSGLHPPVRSGTMPVPVSRSVVPPMIPGRPGWGQPPGPMAPPMMPPGPTGPPVVPGPAFAPPMEQPKPPMPVRRPEAVVPPSAREAPPASRIGSNALGRALLPLRR